MTYSDPLVLIPVAAIFVIIFGIILRALKEMPLFEGAGKVVLAICVATLALIGMDQTIIKAIAIPYAALGVTLLFLLAGLLLAAWVAFAARKRKEPRRSNHPDRMKLGDDR
jgi:hypothetical protein